METYLLRKDVGHQFIGEEIRSSILDMLSAKWLLEVKVDPVASLPLVSSN